MNFRFRRLAALFVSLLALQAVASAVRAADVEDVEPSNSAGLKGIGSRKPDADIVAASDEPLRALQRMKAPAGFEIKLWAAEPMLAKPVAIAFDERGRLFVAETHRYRSSVL